MLKDNIDKKFKYIYYYVFYENLSLKILIEESKN